jgi:alpha-methylacyl-CoA racemase
VVDAAMVDGSASLMTDYYGRYAAGLHSDERGTNATDGGAYYFDAYRCADGKYISIAPVELKFRTLLLQTLGLHEHRPPLDELPNDEAAAVLRSVFATRTRAQWCELREGTDACFAPVLSLGEAPRHRHNVARGTFVEVDGIVQPAPAPRFSRTPSGTPTKPDIPGESTAAALAAWGFAEQEIETLARAGVVGPRSR